MEAPNQEGSHARFPEIGAFRSSSRAADMVRRAGQRLPHIRPARRTPIWIWGLTGRAAVNKPIEGTIGDLESFIQMGLQRLADESGHHTFEQLACRLVKQAVSRRILCSTGPVAVGGDQGRDGESYAADAQSTGAHEIGTLPHPAVLACFAPKSITEDVRAKVRDDAAKMLLGEPRPRSMTFCTTASVPVAIDHELKDELWREKKLHLEIFDRQKLVSLLSEPRHCWIAEQFLRIPSSVMPEHAGLEEEYYQVRRKWKSEAQKAQTYHDLAEIRGALRTATWSEEAKGDISFFSDLLADLRRQSGPLGRKALYEVFVANLRGLDRIDGLQSDLKQYLLSPDKLDVDQELEDAACLLQYSAGAAGFGHQTLSRAEHLKSCDGILEVTRAARVKSKDSSRICRLLETEASLVLFRGTLLNRTPDWEGALVLWNQILALAPEAPMFDAHRFRDRLVQYDGIMQGPEALLQLVEALNDVTEKRSASISAGFNQRDLGVRRLERDTPLEALEHLHKTVFNWALAETRRGQVLALLLLARQYDRLGLSCAARYYSLAASYAAWNSDDPDVKAKVVAAVIQTAESAYHQGAWLQFWRELPIAMYLLNEYEDGGSDSFDSPASWVRPAFYAGLSIAVAKRDPQLRAALEALASKVGLWPNLAQETADKVWADEPLDVVKKLTSGQLVDVPFNDADDTRRIRFSALGVKWSIEYEAAQIEDSVAREFACSVQLLQPVFAALKLVILPGDMTVRLSRNPDLDEVLEATSGNLDYWVPVPTKPQRSQEAWAEFSNTLRSHAFEVTLRGTVLTSKGDTERIVELMKNDEFRRRFMIYQPYHVLEDEGFAEISEFASVFSKFGWTLPEDPRPEPHPQLQFQTDPPKDFDPSDAEFRVRKSYENLEKVFKGTLGEFQGTTWFRPLVLRLREKGWLDWHILGTLSISAYNERVRKKFGASGIMSPAGTQFLRDQIHTPVHANEFPADGPNSDDLELTESANQGSILMSRFGRRLSRQRFPHNAFAEVLAKRFGYYSIDTPHRDPLS